MNIIGIFCKLPTIYRISEASTTLRSSVLRNWYGLRTESVDMLCFERIRFLVSQLISDVAHITMKVNSKESEMGYNELIKEHLTSVSMQSYQHE